MVWVSLVNGRLLVHQEVVNKQVVVGREVVVRYTIYNVGFERITNVRLGTVFDEKLVEIVAGNRSVRFDRIERRGNISYVVVVKPKVSGPFECFATVSYFEGNNTREGFGLGIGGIFVHGLMEYCRTNCCNDFDCRTVFLVFSVIIVLPLLVLYINRNTQIFM